MRDAFVTHVGRAPDPAPATPAGAPAPRRFAPGPTSRFPGELLLALARDSLPVLRRMAEYGDVSQFAVGRHRVYLTTDPDLVRDVLVTHQRSFAKGRALERAKMLLGEGLLTSHGEFHLRQRRLAQPAFHRDRIAAYGSAMVDYTVRRRDGWRHGVPIDVAAEMMGLTLAIVGKTLFDADVEREAPEIGASLTDAMETVRYAVLPFSEVLQHLPIPVMLRFNRAKRRLDQTIYRIIAERRAAMAAGDTADRGDLLSMLLTAQDAPEHAGAGDDGRMSDLQLRDEAMTIFLAGHETTANALTWTLYLLSQHPEVERRLHAELDAALAGRLPAAADLPALPYTRMVLAESMRLFPPAYVIGRRALEDYSLGGYHVPARSIVLVSQHLNHRDPRWWPDPERFDPERFTPERSAERPKFAYFPFGAGTRVCIGEQFAWMEGTLLLATIAQRWRLRLAPGQVVEPKPMITLRPRFGMRMIPEAR
jgi:cytochrome P450